LQSQAHAFKEKFSSFKMVKAHSLEMMTTNQSIFSSSTIFRENSNENVATRVSAYDRSTLAAVAGDKFEHERGFKIFSFRKIWV
jgi:hypothetical protein